jgi:YD repeat-containing protein
MTARPWAMVVRPDGTLYIAGQVQKAVETGADFLTVKYDASGRRVWTRTLDGPGKDPERWVGGEGGKEWPTAIAVDRLGNVIVTGVLFRGGGLASDFGTVKYSHQGDLLWVRYYDGGAKPPDPRNDYAEALTVDRKNNVVVTGRRDKNGAPRITTVKYAP